MSGHSAGQAGLSMHPPRYPSFPSAYPEERSIHQAGVLGGIGYPVDVQTGCEYLYNPVPYTPLEAGYHDHSENPGYYVHAPVHNSPLYQSSAGPFPAYAYESAYPRSIEARSGGSFGSIDGSIESASSFSPSHFSDYPSPSNPVYRDLAYGHPNQMEMHSPYTPRSSMMFAIGVVDPAHYLGPGASLVDRTTQPIAVPALLPLEFQVPYQLSSQFHPSTVQPTLPVPVPAHHHLLERPSRFADVGVEHHRPQQVYHCFSDQTDSIPIHGPQPRRLTHSSLLVDESSHRSGGPQPSQPEVALKPSNFESPAVGFQPGPASGSSFAVTCTPTAATCSSTRDDADEEAAKLIRGSVGVIRRPWPCKYEDQVYTAEDMKLPATKRRRIYINSLEQACNQMHGLLQQHGLLPPPEPSTRPSYLPRILKPKETKLSIVKAQHETTLLKDRLAFLTEMEKARTSVASDEDVLHHPHSDSTLTLFAS